MKRARPPKKSLFQNDDAKEGQHQPVLLGEALTGLIVDKDGIYIDATFGRGGHSREILNRIDSSGVLICIDKDHEAIQVAKKLDDERLIVRQGSFTKLKAWVEELNYKGKISGILIDLGVSSPQLDNSSRGFSFLRDGPLDMRMDVGQPLSATKWLKNAKEGEIEKVLREYGEERFGGRIARAIVKERAVEPIVTTGRLAEIVSRAHPKWDEHRHPATKTFQAIRILVNNELQELTDCLEQCLDVLSIGGRLVVISFHSLEDRIVKSFMKKHECGGLPDWLPVCEEQLFRRIKRVGGKIRASQEEINNNQRSRSAILRIMEKLK
ncbi:MAG: 16S rRNA (cytosine(1402)-N(4))-methyltransferase RsmH [Gammaproteobacteria bacterium]|nr:16S rRNA (cytosine(1402)-N(4))-methyltransferase RsmH [Gammaproteobacteria bacterium]